MNLEKNVPLQPYNTFGIAAKAQALVRVHSEADLLAVLADPQLATLPRQVLGGGSNIVLTGDVKALVLKVEVPGLRLASETDKHWVIEAGAGESWHDLVAWSLDNGYPGLENMALIPGTVGASPVQNIGAYGVELQDRFDSLDAMDMFTGELFSLNAAQCGFSYRDSVFKHASGGPDGLGLLRAAPAAGALCMSIVITRWPIQRRVGYKLLGAVAVFGLALTVFGMSDPKTQSVAARESQLREQFRDHKLPTA